MPFPPGRLVLCPDVAPGRGLGHLQRSLALGEAWRRAGGEADVLLPDTSDDAGRRASGAGLGVLTTDGDGPTSEAVATHAAGRAWAVLDGYAFGARHQAAARAAGRVGLVDDHGGMGGHDADLVVDQNLGATGIPYGAEAGRLLLGPRYALLREAFAGEGRSRPPAERDVLVTLGGAPSPQARAFVAETVALLDLPAEAVATVGPLGAPTTKRGEAVASLGHPADLATTLAATRVALSAAGSTAWELCATGTPAVLVAVADNQEPVGEALAVAGVADYLGPVALADPQRAAAALDGLLADTDRAAECRDAGRRLVDGRGADRVVTAMRALDVDLRPATADDARTLWEWANDPMVRASAFDPAPIPWDDHVAWLDARLADPGTSIVVATEGDGPWGQVRLDAVDGTDGEVDVDVSVVAARRGEGRAGPLLDAAVTRAFRERPDLRRVTARVKSDNTGSRRAFDRAGFVPAAGGDDDVVTLHRERADG